MRDQRAYLLGIAGGQVESDEGADATAKHVRRLATQPCQQGMEIVAVSLDFDELARVVERAARIAAPVV